jgi:hypothetical protein
MTKKIATPKKRTETIPFADHLADNVVNRLFTNGAGQRGSQLRMINSVGTDLGGWCEEAVRRQIIEARRDVQLAAVEKYGATLRHGLEREDNANT